MELHEFIEQSLFEIALGVQSAKVRAKDIAAVAPPRIGHKETGIATEVSFDIEVEASQSSETAKSGGTGASVSAKIYVVEAKIGADGKVENRKSDDRKEAQRISFSVPIYLSSHYRDSPSTMEEDARIVKALKESIPE